LDWFVKNNIGLNTETCAMAALEGELELFQWLHRIGCPWDETSCTNAAENGHDEILAFAREQGGPRREVYAMDADDEGSMAWNDRETPISSASTICYLVRSRVR
jgi:hypothetical protein